MTKYLQTRNRSNAWRVIAYIPREKNFMSQAQASKLLPALKTFWLQQLYKVALGSLVEAQQPGKLNNVQLQLGNREKIVNLKIPVMFIIGDNQGGNTICGCIVNYQSLAKRISRICDAGPNQLLKPKIGCCKRLVMQDVMDLVTEQDEEALKELYQVPHWVAWYDLDYGGNPEGIFTAACPPEPLHALKNGIYQHAIREFFDHILKATSSSYLDALIISWNSYPRQHYMQSFHIDGYPRLLYTSGISKLTNLKADDKVGIIFCIVISSIQETGCNILLTKARTSDKLHRNTVYVFELMLCYRSFLKRKTYWKRDNKETFYNVQLAIEKFLNKIITLLPRSIGQNWGIPKFHDQLHVAKNIEIHGAPENVHTGPQEHNHIENTKKPSKQVQRKKTILDWQLANRLSEKYIINAAYQKYVNLEDKTTENDKKDEANFVFKVSQQLC